MTASELVKYLAKMPPDMPIFVARNAETPDQWLERVQRIELVPRIVLVCDEEEQIV